MRISLTEQTVSLDEVIVTGTAGGQARRELGNAVSTINAAQVTETAPINNLQQLLNGRAPGVFVQPASGAVGSGARVRIRGASSFALGNEPLIYVDGVRVNNAPSSGPDNQGFGSRAISRMNDFNPEDIESIEIIKGPAAATLYGTEASNGVIQIITKKGTAGRPRWNLTIRHGANFLRNPEGRFETNWQAVPRQGSPGVLDTVSIDIIELENARGTPVFRTGVLQEYDLNVGGGSDFIRYYAGAGFEHSQGAEPSNWMKKSSARVNVTVTPSPKLNVNANLGYATGPTHLSAEAGYGGRIWSVVLADARKLRLANGQPDLRRGMHSGLPEHYDAFYRFWQEVARFTGSAQVNHQPTSWFRHRLAVGTDRTREDDHVLYPRSDDSLGKVIFGSELLGWREVNNRSITFTTLDYSGNLTHDFGAIRSTTSFGTQYYQTLTGFHYSWGSEFSAPGLTALSATNEARRGTRQDLEEDVTLGFFGQQQFGWRERLFLTAGLRADDNSAFGQNFDRVYYPKYSLSWVVSDEPFWRLAAIDALKLRAAYGESGKQPVTFAALRTYAPATGPNDVSAVTPQFLGNAELGPERGKEIEFGFDLGALDGRLGAEFTWYRKTTTDAILNRVVAPSIGIPGIQPFNAGEVRNWGNELMLRASPVDGRGFGLDLTLTLSRNNSEIIDLGGPTSVSAGGMNQHRVGFPIGAYFEQRVVSAELNAAGRAINVMCDDGKGGSMPCAGANGRFDGVDDAPNVFLGNAIPKMEGGFNAELRFRETLRLGALFDFKSGYRKIDGNTRVRCNFFGGRCRENFFPHEFDPKRIAGIQSSNNLVDYLIDDASFTRLRELSISYEIPARLLTFGGMNRAAISLAGRNLALWTDFGGLEPEAMFLGGSRGGFATWEQTTLPQLSQWILSLNLGF